MQITHHITSAINKNNPKPPQNTNLHYKSQTHDKSVGVERKITNVQHNPQTCDEDSLGTL